MSANGPRQDKDDEEALHSHARDKHDHDGFRLQGERDVISEDSLPADLLPGHVDIHVDTRAWIRQVQYERRRIGPPLVGSALAMLAALLGAIAIVITNFDSLIQRPTLYLTIGAVGSIAAATAAIIAVRTARSSLQDEEAPERWSLESIEDPELRDMIRKIADTQAAFEAELSWGE